MRFAALLPGAIVGVLLTSSPAFCQKLEAVKEQHFLHQDFGGVGIKQIMFTADGKNLVTAGYHSIRVWDLSGAEPQEKAAATKIDFGRSGLWTMAVSRDGRQVAAGGANHLMRLWEVAGNQLKERAVRKDQTATVRALSFSPDGKVLASGADDRTIWIYDITAAPKELTVFKPQKAGSAIRAIQFLPDGKRLFFAYQGGKQNIGIADVSGAEPVELPPSVTEKTVFRAALSADTKLMAVFTGSDVKLYDFDGSHFKLRKVFKGHRTQGMAVAFSPDGTLLASAGKDAMFIVWDVASGKKLFWKQRSGDIEDIAFSPQDPGPGQVLLAIPTHQREVFLYTLERK